MGIRNQLVCILIFATVSAQSLDDPWLRDPMLVGLWKLTRAINSFGFNLFEDLTNSLDENVLICPYSLSTSLGIIHFGSVGETEKELAGILGYKAVNLTKDEAAQTFYMLSTKQLQSSNPKFYIFDAPSTIIVNRKNGLIHTFQRIVEVLFQAPVTVTDFIESSEHLVRSVNDWVAARTRNKVKHIIDSVDPFSDMIVLNAAYFKGVWVHKFPRENTELGIFYNYGSRSTPTEVHMMRMTNILNFHKDQHHSIVELLFKGRNVSMIILLPNNLSGIGELEYKFSPDFLEEQILKMSPNDVDIVLPKFKIRFSADLTESLKTLGAETLFHPEKVDLSEMVQKDSITFGEVLHKTVVSVAEKGVEAAAATAIFSFKSFPPLLEVPDFYADHPFLFVIYERRIKMVLFVGRVMEL
ncbi:unnamed protein product [Larinioides sclopetarius]